MLGMKAKPGVGLVLVTLLTLAGCGGGDYGRAEATVAAEPSDASGEPAALATIEVGPDGSAMLARADAADGTLDNVVSQCSGCSLAMEGKAVEEHCPSKR